MNHGNLLARLPSYHTLTRYVTFVCTALPATLGSVISFLFHGGAIWCAIVIASGNQKLSRDRPMLMMAAALYAFVAIGTVSTLLNGGREYGWALASGLAFLSFPFSYSIWKISDKTEIINAAIFGSAVSCVGAAVIGTIQYFFLAIRAEGGAGNSIVFATAIVLAMTIVLAGHFHVARRWRPWLTFSYAAGFVALIFSESRMSWFTVAITSAAIIWVYRKHVIARISRRTVSTLGVVALLIAIVAAIPVSQRAQLLLDDWRSVESSGNFETSLGIRLAMWHVGLDAFREAPVIGHGQAETGRRVTMALNKRYGIKLSFTHFHNGFLTAAVETGTLGLIAVFAIFAVLVVNAARALAVKDDPTATFGGTLLMSTAMVYFCMGSVNHMFGHDILDVMFMTMAALGIYLGLGRSLDESGGKPEIR
ncbi:MAG: O-antigen ligase family protein [Rhizobiaceae bacterium]